MPPHVTEFVFGENAYWKLKGKQMDERLPYETLRVLALEVNVAVLISECVSVL